MSKYLMLLLISASLGLTACGSDKKDDKKGGNPGRTFNKTEFPNVNNSIFGRWSAPAEHANGAVFQQRYNFNTKGDIGAELDCITPQGAITVAFVVSGRIDQNAVEVLESAKRTETHNGATCTLELTPGKMNYFINGSTLVFVHPDGNGTTRLTRDN